MSVRNKTKAARRDAREIQKSAAASKVPSRFISVRRSDIRGHRYLASKGLPHSETLAAVDLA